MPTWDELDLLHSITEEFWREYSKLVANSLKRAPEHLHDLLLTQLQEKSSVYGSEYECWL
jgi:hypothetical protein